MTGVSPQGIVIKSVVFVCLTILESCHRLLAWSRYSRSGRPETLEGCGAGSDIAFAFPDRDNRREERDRGGAGTALLDRKLVTKLEIPTSPRQRLLAVVACSVCPLSTTERGRGRGSCRRGNPTRETGAIDCCFAGGGRRGEAMDAAERIHALSAAGASNLLDSCCQDRQRQSIDAANLLDARPP